jgi:antitoxin component HigA of HigAB toxin-antitoxin module
VNRRVTRPAEAIKAHMEMTGRSQGDLAESLGSRLRASEVLEAVAHLRCR